MFRVDSVNCLGIGQGQWAAVLAAEINANAQVGVGGDAYISGA